MAFLWSPGFLRRHAWQRQGDEAEKIFAVLFWDVLGGF